MNKKTIYVMIVWLSFAFVPVFAQNKEREKDQYEFISRQPDAEKKRNIYEAIREGGHAVRVDDPYAIRHAGRKFQNAINAAATERVDFENITARFKYIFYGFVIGIAVTLASR